MRKLYDLVAFALSPSAWWGRTRVEGIESVPAEGPLLVVPNHDSQMDPIVVGVALRGRRRLRFLARGDLWRIPVIGRPLGAVLAAIGQIPIERGAGDAQALERAVEVLRSGEAICVFPEGKLSRGERLRARTGVARLAAACPGVAVVLCAVKGTTDYARFPRRPRVRVSFFTPAAGQPHPGEPPDELATRLLTEIREQIPPVRAGRGE